MLAVRIINVENTKQSEVVVKSSIYNYSMCINIILTVHKNNLHDRHDLYLK